MPQVIQRAATAPNRLHAPHSRRTNDSWPAGAYAAIAVVLGVAAIISVYVLWRGPNRKLFPWTKAKTDEESSAPSSPTVVDDDKPDFTSEAQPPSEPATWREGAGTQHIVLPTRKASRDPGLAVAGGSARPPSSDAPYAASPARVSSLPPSPFPARPVSTGPPGQLAGSSAIHAATPRPVQHTGRVPSRPLPGASTLALPDVASRPEMSPTSPTSLHPNARLPPSSDYAMQPVGSASTTAPGTAGHSKRRSLARRSNGSVNAPPIPSPLGNIISGNEALNPLEEEGSALASTARADSRSPSSSPTKSHRSVSFVNSSPPRERTTSSGSGIVPPKDRPVMIPIDHKISSGAGPSDGSTSVDRRRSRSTPPSLPPGAGNAKIQGGSTHASRTSWQAHSPRRSSSSSSHKLLGGPRTPVYPDGVHGIPTLPVMYASEAYGPDGFVAPSAQPSVPYTSSAPRPRGLWSDETMATTPR